MERQFLLDVMLGKLATYLRMCGYDTLYALDIDLEGNNAIPARTQSTDRTLLTRDQELATRTDNAILLKTRNIEDQLAELHDHGIRLELPTQPDPTRTL